MHTSTRGLIAAMLLAGSALATPAFAQESSAAGTPAQTPTPSDAVAATPPVAGAFTITGGATIASQYRFRGLSQSDNKPVVQATFTVAHSSGFYISTWGSSATNPLRSDGLYESPINIGGTEIDVYGGYTHEIAKSGFTIDIGGYGYIYPGATIGNYYEVYGNLMKTFGPVSAKVGIYYAPNQKVFDSLSGTNHNAYVYGELSGGIPNTPITVHGHVGHTGGGFDYGKDYIDFTAGVTYKWKALSFDISVVGTNLSRDDIARGFASACEGDEEGVSPFGSAAACTSYFRRPAKTIAVGSITASF